MNTGTTRGGYRHGKKGGKAIKVVVPPEIAEAYRLTGRPLAECAYDDLLAGFNARNPTRTP